MGNFRALLGMLGVVALLGAISAGLGWAVGGDLARYTLTGLGAGIVLVALGYAGFLWLRRLISRKARAAIEKGLRLLQHVPTYTAATLEGQVVPMVLPPSHPQLLISAQKASQKAKVPKDALQSLQEELHWLWKFVPSSRLPAGAQLLISAPSHAMKIKGQTSPFFVKHLQDKKEAVGVYDLSGFLMEEKPRL